MALYDPALRRTSRAIILHHGCILLIERRRPGKHYFSIPGGGIEPDETPKQTVLREVAEETGCQVRLGRHVYTLRLPDNTEHYFYLCDYISGEPALPADSPEALESSKDNWFKPYWVPLADIAGLPFMVWEPVRDRLLQDLSQGFPKNPQLLAP